MSVNINHFSVPVQWIDEHGVEHLAESSGKERDLFAAALASDEEHFLAAKKRKRKATKQSLDIDNSIKKEADNNDNNDDMKLDSKNDVVGGERASNVADNNDDDDEEDDSETSAEQTDADWLEIHRNLLQSRSEVEHSIAFLETLRQQQGLATQRQPIEPRSDAQLAERRRVSLELKASKLKSIASTLYANVGVLTTQLDADRRYYAQLAALAKHWRLVTATSTTTSSTTTATTSGQANETLLYLDYTPLLTIANDRAASLERAACVRLANGACALRLPPHRAASLGATIGVYDRRNRRVTSLCGPIRVDAVAGDGSGVPYCLALLRRARQAVWLERTFQTVCFVSLVVVVVVLMLIANVYMHSAGSCKLKRVQPRTRLPMSTCDVVRFALNSARPARLAKHYYFVWNRQSTLNQQHLRSMITMMMMMMMMMMTMNTIELLQ
jgi:hypothetical protein